MREDFVTQLRLQLREAAEHEERRAASGRRWHRRRPPLPPPALAAGIAAVLAALVVAGLALRAGDDATAPPGQRGPRVVATHALVDTGGSVAAGFGSVWVADPARSRVLRVDPDTGAVEAAIDTGVPVVVNTGAGAVWGLDGARGALLRIDPSENRVDQRIDLEQGRRGVEGEGYVEADGDRLWVFTATGALRVDPASGRVVARVPGADPGVPGFWSLGFGSLWRTDADGAVVRFDVATGRREATLRPDLPAMWAVVTRGDALLAGVEGGELARLHPETGAVRWRRRVDPRVNAATRVGSRLLVHGTDPQRAQDRVTVLDVATGRVLSVLPLREFGAASAVTVGRDAWFLTPGGTAIVVRS